MQRIESPGQPPHYRFEALDCEALDCEALDGPEPSAGLLQAVTTRLGGVSREPWASLNLGHTVGDDPRAVAANEQRAYAALGVAAGQVITARQVHGADVARVGAAEAGRVAGSADALVTDAPGVVLLMRFADCTPVLFHAPDRGVVAIAHAGWRGALAGVAAHTARAMIEHYGCDPHTLRVGIGPSIGPCCYEVGAEVYGPMADRWGADVVDRTAGAPGKAHLNLPECSARALGEVGVEHIEMAAVCTCCRREEFFSHRGDGGHTGRFAALIGLR